MERDEATSILFDPYKNDLSTWKNMVTKAEKFARAAHGAQTDKAGLPYCGHLMRVAAAVHYECLDNLAWATACDAVRMGGQVMEAIIEGMPDEAVAQVMEDVRSKSGDWASIRNLIHSGTILETAAWLHDTVEDTAIGLDEIRIGFGTQVAGIVGKLTKDKEIPYLEYLTEIRTDPFAKCVKLADMRDNMNFERLALLPPEQASRLALKYKKGMLFLCGEDMP